MKNLFSPAKYPYYDFSILQFLCRYIIREGVRKRNVRLGGEGMAALVADRLGKKRAVAIGLALNILAAGGLRLLPHSLWGAIVWLVLFYLSFEFAIVCSLLLMTEVLPEQRATTMAAYLAATSIGAGLGAWLAPFFYSGGMWANGLACVVFDLGALLALGRVRVGENSAFQA